MSEPFPNGGGGGAVPYLRELLARLQADRDLLDQRITELTTEISRQERVAARAIGDRKRRRPRGQNKLAIKALFANAPHSRFTLQEIADRTALPLSSVNVAVTRLQKLGFLVKDNDGLFSWEEPRQGPHPF